MISYLIIRTASFLSLTALSTAFLALPYMF